MEGKQLARYFKVLSVETRVRILQLLKGRALCVNALADRLEVTPSAVSQHLRIMREAGLVIDERRGYHIHYRLDEQTLARCLETGEPIRIKTPSCFLPYLAGVPVAEALTRSAIKTILLNPENFFGKIPFPTVAYDEPCYQPERWWRGPTWMPVAYMMLLTLDKTGFVDEARSARQNLYRMLIDDGDLRELFNSETGEGMGAHEQGWPTTFRNQKRF